MEKGSALDQSAPPSALPELSALQGLNVLDGKIIVQIIDRLAQTGTLLGPELFPVGALRKRLTNSLAAAGSPYPDPPTAP